MQQFIYDQFSTSLHIKFCCVKCRAFYLSNLLYCLFCKNNNINVKTLTYISEVFPPGRDYMSRLGTIDIH